MNNSIRRTPVPITAKMLSIINIRVRTRRLLPTFIILKIKYITM